MKSSKISISESDIRKMVVEGVRRILREGNIYNVSWDAILDDPEFEVLGEELNELGYKFGDIKMNGRNISDPELMRYLKQRPELMSSMKAAIEKHNHYYEREEEEPSDFGLRRKDIRNMNPDEYYERKKLGEI